MIKSETIGLLVLNEEDVIIDINRIGEKILKIERGSIIGRKKDEIPSLGEKNEENLKGISFVEWDSSVSSNKKYIFWEIKDEFEINPLLKAIIDATPHPVLLVEASKEQEVIYASPSIENIGLERDEVSHKNFLNIVERGEILMLREALYNSKRFNRIIKKEVTFNIDNITKRASAVISPIKRFGDEVSHYLIFLKETNLDKEDFKELSRTRQLLSSLFDSNPDMVFWLDENFVIEKVNEAMVERTGFSESELKGSSLIKVFNSDHFSIIMKRLLDIKHHQSGSTLGEIEVSEEDQETIKRTNYKLKEKLGYQLHKGEFLMEFIWKESVKYIPVRLSLMPIFVDGKNAGFYGIAKDISENKKNEKLMVEYAYIDTLTKLPNRRSFEEVIKNYKYKKENQLEYDVFTIFFLDVDNFKSINDRYGHKAGDEVLKEVSKRLTEIETNKDLEFFRISGDEFTIIVNENKKITKDQEEEHKKEIESLAMNLKRAMRDPIVINGMNFFVTLSIGISRHPFDTDDEDKLIRYADIAMYKSKRSGKNMFSFFKKEFDAPSDSAFVTEKTIERGIEKNEFELHYQPIVNYEDNTILALEALIRWNHPKRGLIFPDAFITVAESTNLIYKLGTWVVQAACKQIKEWEEQGLPLLPISVNVSGRQLERPEFSHHVLRALSSFAIDPKYIIIEMTESVAIEHDHNVLTNLNRLNEEGCKIAIDDFGTGHSSIGYLNSFPADYLKMDKTFTNNIHKDGRLKKIVEAMVELGHKLGIKVVAEGVESETEAIVLTKIGTDYLQGYHFSKPKRNEEILKYIKENHKVDDTSDE